MKFKKIVAGLTAIGITLTSMPVSAWQVNAEVMEEEVQEQQEESISDDSLVLQVDFDDETADDHSGKENHGEIVGDIEFVEGVEGKAIHIVNSEEVAGENKIAEQYVNFKEAADLKFGTESFSILFWYKSDGTDTNEVSVLSNKDWYSGGNEGLCIADFRNGMGLNFTAQGSSRLDTSRITKATDNEWHHIAAVFDRSSKMTLYVDGENTTTKDLTGVLGKSIDVTDLVLGADGKKHYGVTDSYIDELQIYKRVITEQEVQDKNSLNNLKNKISQYESLLENTDASAEKKAKFEEVLLKIKETLQNTTDLEEISKLSQELEEAYSAFVEPDKGIMEFEVLSDLHLTENKETSDHTANWIDALQDIERYFPDSSGLMTCGDLTQSGYEEQYAAYYSSLEKYGTNIKNVMTALGNHEVRWKSGWQETYERYMRYNKPYMNETDENVYYDKWIDGYHFVVLNTEWDLKDQAYLSEQQLNWFEEIMKEDAQEGKPIFVFFHQALKDTFFNSNDWSEGVQDHELKEILRDYPQTILFTGHIHNGLGACSVVEKEYGTMVDVPSFIPNDYGTDTRGQIGYHVSVYEDKVQFSMRDYKNDSWLAEYNTTIDLNKASEVSGKVLEMNFDEGNANDSSGNENHGTLVGNPKFVNGVNGKALQITNSKSVAGIDQKAEQYLKLAVNDSLELGTDNFTISCWVKGKYPEYGEGAIIANKDWTTGSSQGFAIGTFSGERPGIGLNFTAEGEGRLDTERYSGITDGIWHQVTATFQRDGDMILYVDGQKRNSISIAAQAGKSIDTSLLSMAVGADANGKYGMELLCIDELKIYKTILGEAEIASIYTPYEVEAQQTSALIKWKPMSNANIIPSYIVLDNKKYADIVAGSSSKWITELEPGRRYEAFVVTTEKNNKGNLKDGYNISFQTKADLTALKETLKVAITFKKEEYQTIGFEKLQEEIQNAKLLTQENTQEEVENALKALEEAIQDLKPVEIVKVGWKKENGKWRYQLADGTYSSNTWSEIGKNQWYYFDTDGYMKTGWQKISGQWYYLGSRESGKMVTGWYKEGTKWYYLNKNGSMAVGWKQIYGVWYCFKSNGVMRTGWYQENQKWYYLKDNGYMATNWVKVGTKYYYLYKNGVMARNTWIGRYYVNNLGVWTKSK